MKKEIIANPAAARQHYSSPRIRTIILEPHGPILAGSTDPSGIATQNFSSGSWDGESTNAFGLGDYESGTWK